MGIKEIESRLIKDANVEAEKIKADYNSKLKDLKNQLEEEKKQQSAVILKTFKEKAINTKISLITPHLLSNKNGILLKKKELFENIFTDCMNDSYNLDTKEYKQIIKNLIKSLENEKNCFEIVPAQGKEKATTEALQELTAENKEKWSKFKISVESSPIKGGFVVKGKKMELNFSFETLWIKIKEQYSEDIGQILFERA